MMEYERTNKNEKRKALSERNDMDVRCRQTQGYARLSGISNSRNAVYQNKNGQNQFAASGNSRAKCSEENEKENIIDLSRVKKEPRANIHKLEKKKEEDPSATFQSQKDENSTSKRKRVESPKNETSFDAVSESFNDIQDTRMPWDENSAFDFGYLSPNLTDLIFKPKPNKICRPPNAFMLFAKEHRRQVGLDNPEETNRQISILLGNMWRDLSDEDKMKYYKEAQALEMLHKETYPSYVYSPNEARMRKQNKAERKQKLKETPPSSKSVFISEDSIGSHQITRDPQEKSAETVDDNESKSFKETSSYDPRLPIPENHPYAPMNSSYSPLYFPYQGWPALGNRMPGRNVCTPQYNYPSNIFNNGPASSQPSPVMKGNPRFALPNYVTNIRPFLPFSNPMYPFSPRPTFPENIHPGLWNPWLLCSGSFYCPSPMTNMEEIQKNIQLRVAHQLVQETSRPGPSTGRRVETKSQQSQTEFSDDESEFRPLIIDDGKNSDVGQENVK